MKINKKELKSPKKINKIAQYKERAIILLPYVAGVSSWYLCAVWAKAIADINPSFILMGFAVIGGVLINAIAFYGVKALLELIPRSN